MLSFNHLFHVLCHHDHNARRISSAYRGHLYIIYITVDTGVTYSAFKISCLWVLQLGSDFQSYTNHTGLSLSPAR